MSSVDQRIVQMRFDNAQFESGTKQTISTLDRLKASLQLKGAATGLSNITTASQGVNMTNIEMGVEAIKDRFSTLGIVSMEVIRKLTSSAMDMGAKLTSFFVSPIVSGGLTRALNLEQARFQFKGLGMDVEATMDNALTAVKGTAFGLDEAARVAGQFGATGMTAGDEMSSALRAVSGVAAMTGRSYSDVGHIFTTVSGNGRLMGMQLTQLGSYGLNAAAEIAKSMGTTEAAVRDMASKGQISFEDFYKAMDGAFGEHATKANETYSGSLANVRAALSRLGAEFQVVRIEKMIPIFQALAPVVDSVTEALAPVVVKFEQYAAVLSEKVVGALKRIDFTKLTGDLTDQPQIIQTVVAVFKALWEVLLLGIATVKTIAGIFVYLWDVIEPLRVGFMNLIVVVAEMVGAFAKLVRTSSLGEWFTTISDKAKDMGTQIKDAFLKATDAIQGSNFSSTLEKIAEKIKGLASKIGDGIKYLIASLVDGVGDIDFDTVFSVAGMSLLLSIANNVRKFVKNLKSPLSGLQDILDSVVSILDGVRGALEAWQNSINAKTLLTIAVAIAILAGSLFLISTVDGPALARSLFAISVMIVELMVALRAFSKIEGITKDMAKGLFAIIGIAIAVSILAGAMKKLSDLDWGQIARGLLSVAVLMATLVVAAKALSSNEEAMIKGAAGMIIFALGIRILASALVALSGMSWGSMITGLIGLAGTMGIIGVFLTKVDTSELISTGAGLIVVATGVVILAAALKIIASMSLEELGVGLFGLAGGLSILAITLEAMPDNLPLIGAGLLIVAVGLVVMASALKIMSSMGFENTAIGLGALAMSLMILAIALEVMQNTLAGSAALLVAAIAVAVLAPALLTLSTIPWDGVIRGLTFLAGAIIIFGVAAALLTPIIVPMLGLAAALLLLGIAVLAVGGGLALAGIGLMSLAAGFTALAAMSVVGANAAVTALTTIITGIVTLIPTVATALAEGIIAFAAVVAEGAPVLASAFTAVVSAMLTSFAELIPQLSALFGQALVALIEVIVVHIPLIAEGFLQMILGLLEVIATNIPLLIQAGVDIIVAFIMGIATAVPQLIDAGFQAIIAFIDGLADSIETNTPTLIASMENLFTVIGRAGMQVLSSFVPNFSGIGSSLMNSGVVQGIRGGISSLLSTVGGAVSNAASTAKAKAGEFLSAGASMISGMVSGIGSAVGDLVDAAANAAKRAYEAAKNVLGINSPSFEFAKLGIGIDEGFALGIYKGLSLVVNAATKMATTSLDAVSDTIGNLGNKVLGDIDAQPVIRPIMDLTEIQNGVKDINSLTSSKTTKLAGSVKGVSSTASVLDMIDDVVSSTVGSIFKAMDTSTTKQTDTVIEVPVYLDGREIARATAPYSRQEINKLDKLQVRLGGGTA